MQNTVRLTDDTLHPAPALSPSPILRKMVEPKYGKPTGNTTLQISDDRNKRKYQLMNLLSSAAAVSHKRETLSTEIPVLTRGMLFNFREKRESDKVEKYPYTDRRLTANIDEDILLEKRGTTAIQGLTQFPRAQNDPLFHKHLLCIYVYHNLYLHCS